MASGKYIKELILELEQGLGVLSNYSIDITQHGA